MSDRCYEHRTRCCRKCDNPPAPVEPTTEQEFLGNDKVLTMDDVAVLWRVK